MKVAIQGQKDSFHEVALAKFYGSAAQPKYCDSFKEVFDLLKSGSVDAALVAMENSLYGSINEVYDLVLSRQPTIVGEVYLHIEHCLIGMPQSKLEDIEQVYSHPVALGQCEAFLSDFLPSVRLNEHSDTAGSVVDVKSAGDSSVAAIASAQAAVSNGMNVIRRGIETNKHNYTRFVALTMSGSVPAGSNKTSIVLEVGHSPGDLYKALGIFAGKGINLSKIESRPIVGTRWHYLFYLDLEVAAEDLAYRESVSELSDDGYKVTLLGTYVKDELPAISAD